MNDILNVIFRLADSRTRSTVVLVSYQWAANVIKVTNALEPTISDIQSAELAMCNNHYHQFVRCKILYVSYKSACLSGSIYFVELAQKLADFHHISIKYNLKSACGSNSVDIIDDAMIRGCKDYSDGMINAASMGYVDIVSYMYGKLDTGVEDICEAQFSACENGHLDVIKYFDEIFGANINLLCYGSMYGHLHVVEYAISILSNDAADELFISACSGNQPIIMQWLVDNCNISHNSFNTGIQHAIQCGNLLTLLWFIDHRGYILPDNEISMIIADEFLDIVEWIVGNMRFDFMRALRSTRYIDNLDIVALLLPKLSIIQIRSYHTELISQKSNNIELVKYLENYIETNNS